MTEVTKRSSRPSTRDPSEEKAGIDNVWNGGRMYLCIANTSDFYIKMYKWHTIYQSYILTDEARLNILFTFF